MQSVSESDDEYNDDSELALVGNALLEVEVEVDQEHEEDESDHYQDEEMDELMESYEITQNLM